MCGGIKFIFERSDNGLEQTARVFFSQPVKRKIPVIHKGKKRLIQWGRHEEETQNTHVPQTGWARLDNLDSEYWKRFNPEKVLIPALEFSEKGKLPKSQWFQTPSEVFLMGLQIDQPDQPYVYIVTNPATYGLEDIHPRMPHLVYDDFSSASSEFATALQLEANAEPKQQRLF